MMLSRLSLKPLSGPLAVLALLIGLGTATRAPAQDAYAAKRPVFGGACATCPWGAIADIVRDVMKPAGYDVRVCYNCNLEDSPRIVAERRRPPELTENNRRYGQTTRIEDPVDFGATAYSRLVWSYRGTHEYAKDGPRKNLRLIAFVQSTDYLVAAVKASSDVKSLADLKGRKNVRIMGGRDPITLTVLKHYGITPETMQADGWTIFNGSRQKTEEFDVMIQASVAMANNPETDVWPLKSATTDLRYLDFEPAVLDALVKEYDMRKVELPQGYLRGVDRRIPTVARTGQVVYGRDDMPESFAYDVAKAIDQRRERFLYALLPFSIDPRTVTKAGEVPLHPGAARYYREVGYIK